MPSTVAVSCGEGKQILQAGLPAWEQGNRLSEGQASVGSASGMALVPFVPWVVVAIPASEPQVAEIVVVHVESHVYVHLVQVGIAILVLELQVAAHDSSPAVVGIVEVHVVGHVHVRRVQVVVVKVIPVHASVSQSMPALGR